MQQCGKGCGETGGYGLTFHDTRAQGQRGQGRDGAGCLLVDGQHGSGLRGSVLQSHCGRWWWAESVQQDTNNQREE